MLKYILQARDRGVAVIFITHNPHHAYPVGDRFVILNRGQSLGNFAKSEIDREELMRLMAGGARAGRARARARGDQGRGGVVRLTAAQALVRFLAAQYVERDGVERRFFGGCFGIFGHGNVAGIGEALYERPELLTYYQARNEQGMVHTAVGYARQLNRLGALACTTSIGPGATNMVTGAALATVNRLPVLLLPGDVFASRRPGPGAAAARGAVGRRRVGERLLPAGVALLRPDLAARSRSCRRRSQAMRVLVNQAETGAVTLAFPQDVQAEAFDVPEGFLDKRVWHVPRPLPGRGGARARRWS